MKLLKTFAIAALALLSVVAPAAAQWQVTQYGVPVGRAANVTGFNVATTGTAGRVLLDLGASTNPAFTAISGGGSLNGSGVLTLDNELNCFVALTSAADKMVYYTGSGTCALADLSSFARTLLDDAAAVNMRSTLGVVLGVDVQAFSERLKDIASDITWNQGDILYFNGTDLVDLAPGTSGQFLKTQGAGANPVWSSLDADLETIAGLTATTDNVIQSVGSAWASRTPAQLMATLAACIGDAGSGGTKGLVPTPAAGDASKFLRGDCTFVAIPGGGDALVANPLSQFAATTSLQFSGVISDETGTGKIVLDTAPQISTIELGAATDTTLARASAGNLTVEGNALYRAGGTDVALADGGTGSSLTDPNADRFAFWDDSAGFIDWLVPTPNLVFSTTNIRSYETWCVAASDETTALTTGTAKATWSFPYGFNVVGVYASINTVSSSGTPTFDINEAGTTIISTKIVIDVSEKSGGSSAYQGTAAAAAVVSDASIAAFAEMSVDIDTAGTGAKGAKVCVIGYP